jgi:hypothetical protein
LLEVRQALFDAGKGRGEAFGAESTYDAGSRPELYQRRTKQLVHRLACQGAVAYAVALPRHVDVAEQVEIGAA